MKCTHMLQVIFVLTCAVCMQVSLHKYGYTPIRHKRVYNNSTLLFGLLNYRTLRPQA